MPHSVIVSIDESTGDMRFLVNAATTPLITEQSIIRRASYVEPWNPILRGIFKAIRFLFNDESKAAEFTRCWPCMWRVNFSPVGGPLVLVEWASRQSAIDFEMKWLEENWL